MYFCLLIGAYKRVSTYRHINQWAIYCFNKQFHIKWICCCFALFKKCIL